MANSKSKLSYPIHYIILESRNLYVLYFHSIGLYQCHLFTYMFYHGFCLWTCERLKYCSLKLKATINQSNLSDWASNDPSSLSLELLQTASSRQTIFLWGTKVSQSTPSNWSFSFFVSSSKATDTSRLTLLPVFFFHEKDVILVSLKSKCDGIEALLFYLMKRLTKNFYCIYCEFTRAFGTCRN